VLGEVQFEGKTNVEKTSGVWVDGQYVGYLNELKASKKVLLLPGEHTIRCARMDIKTYPDSCPPAGADANHPCDHGQRLLTGPMPADPELATIKINVNPSRAAVFVDGRFVGHVGEFGGLGRAMQGSSGGHTRSGSHFPAMRPFRPTSIHCPGKRWK